jgi:hypothetical protein
VLVEQDTGDVLLAGLAAILLHFIFLTFHVIATWLARCPEPERKAIIIMASQKNLWVAGSGGGGAAAGGWGHGGRRTCPG